MRNSMGDTSEILEDIHGGLEDVFSSEGYMITAGAGTNDIALMQIKKDKEFFDVGIDVYDEQVNIDHVKKCSTKHKNVKEIIEKYLENNNYEVIQYQSYYNDLEGASGLEGAFKDASGIVYCFQVHDGNTLFDRIIH